MARPRAIGITADEIDLTARFFTTATVAASPATNEEKIIASLTINADVVVVSGIAVAGWAAFTLGTSGVSAQLKIHHTDASGATLGDTGATTAAAAALYAKAVLGFDAAPVLPGQVYVLTLQVASGGAISTVSAVRLFAIVV